MPAHAALIGAVLLLIAAAVLLRFGIVETTRARAFRANGSNTWRVFDLFDENLRLYSEEGRVHRVKGSRLIKQAALLALAAVVVLLTSRWR